MVVEVKVVAAKAGLYLYHVLYHVQGGEAMQLIAAANDEVNGDTIQNTTVQRFNKLHLFIFKSFYTWAAGFCCCKLAGPVCAFLNQESILQRLKCCK